MHQNQAAGWLQRERSHRTGFGNHDAANDIQPWQPNRDRQTHPRRPPDIRYLQQIRPSPLRLHREREFSSFSKAKTPQIARIPQIKIICVWSLALSAWMMLRLRDQPLCDWHLMNLTQFGCGRWLRCVFRGVIRFLHQLLGNVVDALNIQD